MSSLKEAFAEASPAITAREVGAQLAPPQRYQPRGGEPVWMAEIDVARGGTVIFPAAVELLVLRNGEFVQRCTRQDLMHVAASAIRSMDDPMPHLILEIRGLNFARLVQHVDGVARSAPTKDPAAAPTPDEVTDALIRAADPPWLVKGAAGAQAVTGLLISLTGLQLAGSHWYNALAEVMPYLLMTWGIPGLFFAASQFRGRKWAAFASAIYGVLSALLILSWNVYVLTTIMSPLMYMATGTAMLSAPLSCVAIPAILKSAEARRKLAAQGFSLGL